MNHSIYSPRIFPACAINRFVSDFLDLVKYLTMASYLITGCSRGLGLKLVQKLLEKPSSSVETIFATARSEQPSQLLQDVISVDPSRVKYVRLDVEDPASIELALAQVQSESQPALWASRTLQLPVVFFRVGDHATVAIPSSSGCWLSCSR